MILSHISQKHNTFTGNIIQHIDSSNPFTSFLNFSLIETSKFTLHIWDIVTITLIIVATGIVLGLIKKTITKNKNIDQGKQYSLYSLTKYVIIVFVAIWILQYLGVKVTILLGGSAALLVGVGMGLQNLFSDFISGIILLIDSSIKVNDVIEVNGLVCQVKQIKLRTTQVLTRDDKYILLPNSSLTKNNIINWTHNLETSRFDVSVDVSYDADVNLVKELLLNVAQEHDEVLQDPKPFVRLISFGDSSIDFNLYFWSKNIFRVENIKSDLRFMIFEKLNEHNIEIPFPQHVIHKYKENNQK